MPRPQSQRPPDVLVECVKDRALRTTAQLDRGPSSLFDADGLSFQLLA
jgi:hypothetical protein